jgi:hypothetical protein
MQKKNLILSLLSLIVILTSSFANKIKNVVNPVLSTTKAKIIDTGNFNLYDSLHLEINGLNRQVFDYAIRGYQQLVQLGQLKNLNTLSIIDFSMPSKVKRLFVLDLIHFKLLFNTYVAHGRNSGLQTATTFSNTPESFKSSLGFYSTENIYNGKHGSSLQLKGLEKGFNDNALSRGIVMHAAKYVDENIAKVQGHVGRSLGCPAVPEKLHAAIIGAIANGSCLFMYANDQNYLTQSRFIN